MGGTVLRQDVVLLVALSVQLAAAGVVATAGALVARRAGARRHLDLLAAGLLTVLTAGWLAFWAHLLHPAVGRVVSAGLLLGAVTLVGVGVGVRSWRPALADLRVLVADAVLVTATAVLVASAGFLYGGVTDPLATPAVRYTHQLPSDNAIPHLLAEAVWRGEAPPDPIVSDYQSSDRPPLQAGMFLVVRPLAPIAAAIHYQAFGIVAQVLFVSALHALLVEARVRAPAVALVLAAATVAGVTLLYGLFVWPKLLPVAPLLLVVAYVLTDDRDVRGSALAGAAVGLSAAAAVLAHGGSLFALAGIGLVLVIARRVPAARFVGAAVVVAAVAVGPWLWYRTAVQPPGNRLEKWHLAGVEERDERSTVATLATAYGDLSAADVVAHKARNLRSLLGDPKDYRAVVRPGVTRTEAVSAIRDLQFTYYLPALGVFAAGPLALLAARSRRDSTERRFARRAWSCVAAGIGVWALAMFGPGTAIVYYGSLLFVVLAVAGSVLAYWVLDPRIAVAAVAVSFATSMGLYLLAPPSTPVDAPAVALRDGLHPLLALTAVGSLAVIGALLWQMAHASPPAD